MSLAADYERQRFHSRVRSAVKRAVASGLLVREPCVVCGRERSEAHHEDYNKPLEVIWLCRLHHSWRHKYSQSVDDMIAHRDEARANTAARQAAA